MTLVPSGTPSGSTTGRKIRMSTRIEVVQVYEIDVDVLLQDGYFEDADLMSHESMADRFESYLVDAPEKWKAPWARELQGLGDGFREVYEIDLNPEAPR